MKYTSRVQKTEYNIHEAAAKPFMGLTAFLSQGEPWLVVAFDKKQGHTLVSREGTKVTLKTPFDWVQATDRSRLVAALCDEGCSIPGTPHFSADHEDWFFRVGDVIFDPEEIVEYIRQSNLNPFDEEIVNSQNYQQNPGQEFQQQKPCVKCGANSGFDPNGACLSCGTRNDFDMQLQQKPDPNWFLGHQVQTPDSRQDERAGSDKCPDCGSHTTGNRIAEFSDDGKPIFHCKSCGNKFQGGENIIVNPKLTYEVDKGKDYKPYAPGPDDPNKVCEGCGYSWKDHHQFSISGGKCPHCHHKQEDVMAMEGKGKKSTFENDTQDSMSGKDTGAVNQSNPTEYRGTDITDGSSNVTAPINTFQGPEGLFAVKGTPDQIEGVNWQGSRHGPFSVLPEDVQRAQQFLTQAKTARRAFAPSEQQDLIDENMGAEARNSHKLNLENTHYRAKEERDPYLLWW